MNTKILMTASALLLGIMGVVLLFLSDVVIIFLNITLNVETNLFMQILGSLYLGFGAINWMSKSALMGGIYNRPISIGNFMHFGASAIALLKIVFGNQVHAEVIIPLAIIYTIFAVSFAYVFMTNPGSVGNEK